jgi:hypothetical protein
MLAADDKNGWARTYPSCRSDQGSSVHPYRSPISYLIDMQRVVDWFFGLSVARKVLAVLFGGLLLFSVTYLITSGVLWLMFANPEESTSGGETARSEETSTLDEQFAAPPGMDLQITRAAWVGNTVEVEGSWGGEISSVHCDLFEGGGDEQRVIDWWERSVLPTMSWSERTFTQVFVEAEGEVEEPIDPSARYSVTCSGAFADGWSTNDNVPVAGEPSG